MSQVVSDIAVTMDEPYVAENSAEVADGGATFHFVTDDRRARRAGLRRGAAAVSEQVSVRAATLVTHLVYRPRR